MNFPSGILPEPYFGGTLSTIRLSPIDNTLTCLLTSPSAMDMTRKALDLLSAPASISLAHVGRGLNGRDELEDGVADTNESNDRSGDNAEDATT